MRCAISIKDAPEITEAVGIGPALMEGNMLYCPSNMKSWREGNYMHRLLAEAMYKYGMNVDEMKRPIDLGAFRLAEVLADIYAAGFLHGCRVHKQIEKEKRARRRKRGAAAHA